MTRNRDLLAAAIRLDSAITRWTTCSCGGSARVVYTPEDDPINGQMNGADPAWIILRSEHGNESSLHDTVNVQHNETWTWDIPDMRILLVGIPLDFEATATDPGSDDLMFTWDWGDVAPATVNSSPFSLTFPQPVELQISPRHPFDS